MDRRSLISFLLLTMLSVQASLPCCLVAAAWERCGDQPAQGWTSCRCHGCPKSPTQQRNDVPLPADDEPDGPHCPFCAGTADMGPAKSVSKDIQHLQPTVGRFVRADVATITMTVTDACRMASFGLRITSCDPGMRLQI